MISVDEFFRIFEEELKQNKNLQHYHRFINSERSYKFRRAYYQQRLQYMLDKVGDTPSRIMDLGCGYGTSSILLAMNGHSLVGTTLEYYFDEINSRLEFWKKYIDVTKIEFKYENIFFSDYNANSFDFIVAQDTLHHIEPIKDALKIFKKILTPDGIIIVNEENGNNPICNIKHIRERGFKRIVKIYDEKLGQTIMFGNENTRSFKKWQAIFNNEGFELVNNDVEYIRVLPPSWFKNKTISDVITKEKQIQHSIPLLKDKLYFGINFCAKPV